MTAVRGRPSLRGRAGRSLGRILLCLAWFTSGFVAWLWWRQETLLFRARALAADHRFDFAPDIHEKPSPSRARSSRRFTCGCPTPQGLIFFLHGQRRQASTAGSPTPISTARPIYDLFMVDYRGYGKSSGRIESQRRSCWPTSAPLGTTSPQPTPEAAG